MDHNEAVRLQAAEKYTLGELPEKLKEEYEEHFFECAECALDVKAAAAFADNSREILKRETKKAATPDPVRQGSGWLAWFRPVIAVPAFAVLLLALGYQSFISVPHWKKMATESAAPRVLPMFSLIAANTRGPEGLVFHVRQGERFGLYVDVPNDETHTTYLLRLVDPAGRSTILRSLSYAEAQKTQVVEVNPGETPGTYQMVVLGLAGQETDPAKGTALATMKFSIEFSY